MANTVRKIVNQYLDVLIAFICFGILVFLISETKSVFGGADTYQHFLINKESVTNPSLFLHHWGKPVFVLLSSPFAQFGMFGLKVFNALVICIIAICCSRLIKKFNGRTYALVIPLIIGMPIVFQTVFSGLTEPLFSMFLVLSILLFANNKIKLALILISFIPMVRNEGFIFFPLFIAGLFWIGRLKESYWILTGTILYSVLGFFFHDKGFFWLFSSNPYTGKSYNVNGELLHYVYKLPEIIGPILSWVSALAILFALWKLITLKDKPSQATFMIMLCSLLGYFAAHSFIWWYGMTGSLGFLRIMMPIAPLIAVFIILMIDILFKKKVLINWLLTLILVSTAIVFTNFKILLPKEVDFEEKGLILVSEFLETQPNYNKLLHYNPALCYFTGRELFNYETSIWIGYGFTKYGENNIICWDSHFGAQEGGTPVEKLIYNKKLELLTEIIPDPNALVFNTDQYKLLVFRSHKNDINDIVVEDAIFNAENLDSLNKNSKYQLNQEKPFFEIYSEEISSDEKYINILSKIRLKEMSPVESPPSSIIISLENESGILKYYNKEIEKKDDWQDLSFEKSFPLIQCKSGDRVKIYVWYQGKGEMKIDNIETYITKVVPVRN